MDFALMFCPYCGGDVDTGDGSKYLCRSCGKSIYTDRGSALHFIRPGEKGDRLREAMDALRDDNPKKAQSIADELLEISDDDFDAHFLLGAIYASMGEDGRAAAEWKRGLDLLTVYTNIDAYICLMARCISDMMYDKEREYVEFEPLRYIDKLCDEIYASTAESCKAFFYYAIYRDYRSLMGSLQAEGKETFTDVIPKLFRRIVEYHHNFWCLIRIIDEYLVSVGYNADTYVDDEMEEFHVYDLIRKDLISYTSKMDEGDMRRIMAYWDDVKLKENEVRLESILPRMKDVGVIGMLLAKRSAPQDQNGIDEPDAVDAYVRHCLLMDLDESEKPEMVQ